MSLKYFYDVLKKYSNLFSVSTIITIEEHKDYISYIATNFKDYHHSNKRELKLYFLCIFLLINNFGYLHVDKISSDVYKINVLYTCTDEILLSDFNTKRKYTIMRYAKRDFLDLVMYSDILLNSSKTIQNNSIIFRIS